MGTKGMRRGNVGKKSSVVPLLRRLNIFYCYILMGAKGCFFPPVCKYGIYGPSQMLSRPEPNKTNIPLHYFQNCYRVGRLLFCKEHGKIYIIWATCRTEKTIHGCCNINTLFANCFLEERWHGTPPSGGHDPG